MDFAKFVQLYWKKTHGNGKPWTNQEIVNDSDLKAAIVDVYMVFCQNEGAGLNDQQLIDKFNNGYYLMDSVFSPLILKKEGAGASQGTLAAFITDLKALIDHYTK